MTALAVCDWLADHFRIGINTRRVCLAGLFFDRIEPMTPSENSGQPHRRRPRYRGTHPRRFDERYKEHNRQQYPEIVKQVRSRGGTPAGTHVPVLLQEVLEVLRPAAGNVVADCTLGFGGHAEAIIPRIQPEGRYHGFDVDAEQLERTSQRLAAAGLPIVTHRSNFAGVGKVMANHEPAGFDLILADVGVSSMQVDDPRRGFSYKSYGPLDMRMDNRLPRTAADWLAALSEAELVAMLEELADEPAARSIAKAIIARQASRPIRTTGELTELVLQAKGITKRAWQARDKSQRELHPAARTFQALRIKVNDELGALRNLLRVAPSCLKAGGRIAIISFHSGEDRIVASAFEDGVVQGVYSSAATAPIRPTPQERYDNPRSSSALLRWAVRANV